MARERRDFNRISGIRDPSLIVIATEGEKTEQQYFFGLQSKCEEVASRIQFKILDPNERGAGKSAAKYVLGQLDQYKKEFNLNSYDELCMVIDRDKQSLKESELSEIAQQCDQKKYLLALSNPAFELWLILHLKDLSSYSATEKEKLLENKDRYLKKELKRLLLGFKEP